jgi:hypothetical protein
VRFGASIALKKLERERADGGSLFDVRETPIKDIAKIIAETVTVDRLRRLQTEIAKQIATRKPKALAG